MASLPPSHPAAMRARTRGGKGKEHQYSSSNNQQQAIRLKVVIRHLPSLLKPSEFREITSNCINEETTEYFRWIQGKIPEDRNKPATPSRCYVKMKDHLQITALNNALKSHGPFTDGKGNHSVPLMEFSPFQKTPKQSQRIDARAGTIVSDSDFQEFLAALNPISITAPLDGDGGGLEGTPQPSALDPNAPAPIPVNDPLSVPMPSNQPAEKPTTTPLIEYIRTQKNGPVEKPATRLKAPERVVGESSRSAKRGERRAREKAARLKGKDKERSQEYNSPEPMALLKRSGPLPSRSGPSTVSSSGTRITERSFEKLPVITKRKDKREDSVRECDKEKDKEKETDAGEKIKCRDRERRRGGPSSVAAILQRDLGLGGPSRRPRGRGFVPISPAESETPKPTTPKVTLTEIPSVSQASPQPPDTPSGPTRKLRERPSRRERRAAKLEREEIAAFAASTASAPPSPADILKKQANSSVLVGDSISVQLKKDWSVYESTSQGLTGTSSPGGPSDVQQKVVEPIPPTGPRGFGERGNRGRPRINRPEVMAVGNLTSSSSIASATAAGPPTGPAADLYGGRGRNRGRGSFRGGRGRGIPRGGSIGN